MCSGEMNFCTMIYKFSLDSQYRCTILIPLKDNPTRTRHFLRHNNFPEFRYIFADGSFGDENQRIFKGVKQPNFEYIRYPPDARTKDFLLKMQDAASRVNTEFAMTMDTGDYLIAAGLSSAIDAITSQETASSALGDIYTSREIGPLLTNPILSNTIEHIANLSLDDAMTKISNDYAHLWYAVFRRETFQINWQTISEETFSHPFMEYFPTILSLSHGHAVHCKEPYIVRINTPPRRWTKQPADMQIGEEEDAEILLQNFALRCHELLDVPAEALVTGFLSNTKQVLRSLKRKKLGPRWLAAIMPSSKTVSRYSSLSQLERKIGYYISILRIGTQVNTSFPIRRIGDQKYVLQPHKKRRHH